MVGVRYFSDRMVLILGIVCMGFAVMAGCGGGGDSGAAPAVVKEGVFVDSAVEGLTYATTSQTGLTDALGTFRYQEGEMVLFSVGDVVLGEAPGKGQLTPLDLVPAAADETDPTVSNICRFLQSLDLDGNPANGIHLSPEISNEVSGRNIDFSLSIAGFETDPDLKNLFDSLNLLGIFPDATPRELCPAATAQSHLRDTLSQLDRDGDGFSVSQGDCDDTGAGIYPGAPESCGDGIDQDCSGSDLLCVSDISEYELNLFQLINDYRFQQLLAALEFDSHLNDLARGHSQNMEISQTMSHDGFQERYESSGFNTCVENVGWNYATPEAMFEGWRTSDGHNRNMLNERIEFVGISKVGDYITFFACGN